MKVITSVMEIRMSIPPALPVATTTGFPVVDLEVIIGVPANREGRCQYSLGIVRSGKLDPKFEMTVGVRDGRPLNLLCGVESSTEMLQERSVDWCRASPITGWRHHPYPETCSVDPERSVFW